MDERNTVGKRCLDRIQLDCFAVDQDVSGILSLHAGENLHERAFARAIFTDHREYFTRAEG